MYFICQKISHNDAKIMCSRNVQCKIQIMLFAGFLENQDRGSRIEDRGSRIQDRVKKEKEKNHEVPSAQDIEEGWTKIKFK